VQTLELLNGTEYHDRIYKGEVVAQLVKKQDNAKLVERVYWAALSRAPSASERDLAITFLTTGGRTADTIGDMFWALMSSPEFQYLR
jgi:hypothetical protein